MISEPSRAAAELRLLVSFSIITIICGGKGITHQSEALGKWPRQRPSWAAGSQGSAGVLRVSVCFVINHLGFEENGRRHSLYPPLLFILLLLPHGRWPSHPIWPSHWGQGQPKSHPHISPLPESPFTPNPLNIPPCLAFPLQRPFVHLLSWRLDCCWDHPSTVCVWQRSGQKLK